jgi:multiple sugar transport system substrate-binding protein
LVLVNQYPAWRRPRGILPLLGKTLSGSELALMTTLRIALRDYKDFENALAEEARLFEANHPGIAVELVSIGIHELYRSALGGGLNQGQFDLALLVTDWLAEGMASRALEDLSVWQRRLPVPDWPDGWASSLVRQVVVDNRLSSLPWHDGPECLVYRSDLFSDPLRRAKFRALFGRELAPPATWEQFDQTARFLTDPLVGVYGTVFAAFPDGHNTLYDFALQVWSRGGELFGRDGVPRLNSSAGVGALDFYRRIIADHSACHPRSPQLDSTQSGDLFLAGEVAMMVNWFGFATRSERAGSALRGKVAIATIPCDPGCKPVSLSVFWALAMGAGSRNKDLAWEFLRFAAGSGPDLGITRHGPVGTRLSTWRNPALQAQIPAYRELETISLGARRLPTGPQLAQFAATIDRIVTRALSTTDPSVDILGAAQHEIECKGIRFP